MKHHITTALAQFIAIGTALAASGPASAPPGSDNIAFGYGSGYQSSGINTNVVVIGTDAGMSASNNVDCIFIGREAGKGFSGRTGEVVIGDVLVHTGGVTTIKGFANGGVSTNVVCDIVTNDIIVGYSEWTPLPQSYEEPTGEGETTTWTLSEVKNGLAHFTSPVDMWKYPDGSWTPESLASATNLVFHQTAGLPTAFTVSRTPIYGNRLGLAYRREIPTTYLRYESGTLNVYTNGVRIGTLSMTPAQ